MRKKEKKRRYNFWKTGTPKSSHNQAKKNYNWRQNFLTGVSNAAKVAVQGQREGAKWMSGQTAQGTASPRLPAGQVQKEVCSPCKIIPLYVKDYAKPLRESWREGRVTLPRFIR